MSTIPQDDALTVHGTNLARLDVLRRKRVRTEDRERRMKDVCAAIFMCIPLIWMYLYGDKPGSDSLLEWAIILWSAAAFFTVPVFLVRVMFPQNESWASRKRLPTFVPPPPMLEDGTRGAPWSADVQDVVFDRIRLVLEAVDGRDASAVQASIAGFMRRARELCDYRTLGSPSRESPYHYWPNKKTEPGAHDGDTVVTYEDNHPIQHQRSRLMDTVRDLRHALACVPSGVDDTDTSIALRDVIAVLRRVVELEGFDASRMRPKKSPVIETGSAKEAIKAPAYEGPGADVIALVAKAVRLDPNLTDGLGNPIAPLLTQHVPRLVEVYRRAIETSEGRDHEAIDLELLEGLELVRRATEEGLAKYSDQRRQELRNEIAFLRMRGAQEPLLSLD